VDVSLPVELLLFGFATRNARRGSNGKLHHQALKVCPATLSCCLVNAVVLLRTVDGPCLDCMQLGLLQGHQALWFKS
jgi:hypothetical protein